jgi:polar amino acid transport system permease protein
MGNIIAQSLPYMLQAFLTTLELSAIVVVISTVLGLLVAVVRQARVPVLSQVFMVYEEIFRNTPLLIQLFFFGYGFPAIGIKWSFQFCAIFGASLLGGAYMAAAFRGGFGGVPKIQGESARALGMSALQRIRYIIVPQGLTRSVPGVAANAIFLVKETSVFSVLAIPELTSTARDLIDMFYQTNTYLVELVIGYAIILIPLSILLTWLERRVRRATFAR